MAGYGKTHIHPLYVASNSAWLNSVHRICAETAAFHVAPAMQQPQSAYQYTTSVDINNTRYKRIQSLIYNHMRHVRIESAREQRIALYKNYE